MKKILAITLAVLLVLTMFAGCGSSKNEKKDYSQATSLADFAGAKVAAQAGTFHADAVKQIENVQSSEYPDFTDLLVALQSDAIDGYVAEEPTALAVCLADDSLTYVALKNNETGFAADASDVGIAVGLKSGSELTSQINDILASLTPDVRAQIMEAMVKLSNGEEAALPSELAIAPAQTTGTLRVGMECAYEPFNWTQPEMTNGAVPIANQAGLYANGYDVQIAKYIAAKLGYELEVYAIEWDSLIPAVKSGNVDAIIAGMSPTAERATQIDFTDVYYESNLVIIVKKTK